MQLKAISMNFTQMVEAEIPALRAMRGQSLETATRPTTSCKTHSCARCALRIYFKGTMFVVAPHDPHQFEPQPPARNVRFGSKADIAIALRNVRYWPKADTTVCTAHVRFRE
jgi:hypothetical protein